MDETRRRFLNLTTSQTHGALSQSQHRRGGGDISAPCALIFWSAAERQHCLFNPSSLMRGGVKGHCIAFVRSAVEVALSSGPSCCRQLGHATYIESNYPCQLITAKSVPSANTHTHTHGHTHTQRRAKIPLYKTDVPDLL